MNKQLKRIFTLSLTISLASAPFLNEVSKANEFSDIQESTISFLSTEIDESILDIKVNQFSMDDFALTILEQPDIVDLEVMENLPEHQQAIRNNTEEYLKDIKPELIDLNERSILVAQYMELYNDYFVSEIENVQEKKSSEQEARQNIEAGLQELTGYIEKEQAEVTETQKEIESSLVTFEEDYEAFEGGVAEAEEYVIEQEGKLSGEVCEIKERLKIRTADHSTSWAMIGAGIATGVLGLGGLGALMKLSIAVRAADISFKGAAATRGTIAFVGLVGGGSLIGAGIANMIKENNEVARAMGELEGNQG